MKRYIGAAAVFLMALAVGCSRPDRAATSDQIASDPVTGDWVIVRLEAEPDSLNPILSTNSVAGYVQQGMNGSQIFESLLQYDSQAWTITKPVLAEAYPEISADRLTYTFTLRDGVKWHDGQPFTVDDVLFSAKVLVCPTVDSAPLRSFFGNLKNVENVEERKVRFTFDRPNFLNANNLGGFPIISRRQFDPNGVLDGLTFVDMLGPKGRTDAVKKFSDEFNKHAGNRAPIGTGPYKFERWDTGKEIVLARNDGYWGSSKPYLDKITYRIIQDYTAALTALKSGDLDFNTRMLPIQFAQQTSGEQFDSQFAKTAYSIPAYSYIGWNQERPYFKDKRVRQAMTMLINRPQIIETIRYGLDKPTESHFNPSSAAFNPNLKPYPYDPARAMQLLDEAGWTDTDGDGVREKDGTRFSFEFLISSGSSMADTLPPILKEEFRKAGIEMTERRLEFTVFADSLRDHKFDAATAAWTSGLTSDPYQLWHSSSASNRGSNYISFKNAEADRLIEEARLEFDEGKRKQLYGRWQEIIYEEQPYTFLFVNSESAAWHKRFQNVKWYPPRPGYDLHQWFVPTALQKYGLSQ